MVVFVVWQGAPIRKKGLREHREREGKERRGVRRLRCRQE